MSGNISLRFIELSQFRRLGKVQVDVDPKTTILVGANNSGKTSILAALRHFLADGSPFGAFDISVSQWPKLRGIGRAWDALEKDPSTFGASEDESCIKSNENVTYAKSAHIGCKPFSCGNFFHFVLALV